MASNNIAIARTVIADSQSQKIKGDLLDVQTAHVIVTVHDALSAENQAKFAALPLSAQARIAWSLVA